MQGLNVVFVYADTPIEWNCSEWRMLAPSDAMNLPENRQRGWHGKLIHVSGFMDYMNPAIQDLVMPGDLIVVQRNLVNQVVLDAIEYYKGMGKPIVADLDDAYQILPWSNPAHRFWIDNPEARDPPPLVMLEQGLSHCDALTAPNRLLLSDWAHVVDGFHLPNFARSAWWSDLPERGVLKAERGLEGRVIIGWGGSVSHYDSWWGSGLREAAARISRRHPEVLWLVCGNDFRIHTQLPVPADQKMAQPGVPPQDWPRTVRGFDIGVAPLFGPYDQRRSWIKGLEYLLGGVPWVATAGEPYRDLAALGRLVRNSAEAWEDALETVLARLPAEQERAAARVERARAWTIERQLGTYADVYNAIKANTRARQVILPGLRFVGGPQDGERATPGVSGIVERVAADGNGRAPDASTDVRADSDAQPRVVERAD